MTCQNLKLSTVQVIVSNCVAKTFTLWFHKEYNFLVRCSATDKHNWFLLCLLSCNILSKCNMFGWHSFYFFKVSNIISYKKLLMCCLLNTNIFTLKGLGLYFTPWIEVPLLHEKQVNVEEKTILVCFQHGLMNISKIKLLKTEEWQH